MEMLSTPSRRLRLHPNPFYRSRAEILLVCDPTDYCPGCDTRLGCVCPTAAYEDAVLEAAYTLGLDHGSADGPDDRPTRDWCEGAGLDADEYLAGYDAGSRAAESTSSAVVCELATAFARPRRTRVRQSIPLTESEVRAQRVAAEATRWLAFAGERTRMRPETLLAKTLQSACFSVETGASGFAVPSKLVRVSENQRRLWALVRDGYDRYERLDVDTSTVEGVRVCVGDEVLGEVQSKHVPWVRPLVAFGLTVHLSRVTGHETEGHTLGLNVVFGGVGRALAALTEALGSGDGASGDGAAAEGTSVGLRLVVPDPAPLDPSEDIVLWREARGTAHASVGTAEGARLQHVVRHSPTGIEWGYGGSGPSDLALSVLTALAGADAAERHYRAFVAEVVSRLPRPGGVLRADRVRAWLRRQAGGQAPTQNPPAAGRAAA
jgi:hypothetical protein